MKMCKRNKSGITGVHLIERVGRSPTWNAYWGNKRIGFSVKNYGFEEAKRLAIEARENGINAQVNGGIKSKKSLIIIRRINLETST